MSETRKNLGLGALALLPIVCCIGVPLIVAAGVSVALAAWVSGIAIGGIVLVGAIVLLAVRVRRHRTQRPSLRITGSGS